MTVKFVDLTAQYRSLQPDIDAAIKAVIDETAFIGGRDNRFVCEFESAFADWLGVEEVIGCGNGTDAIEILLQAAGIGRGDEVIVPALTWISTGEAVSTIGATPVFADIDSATYTICPASAAKLVTSRTRAVIAVHLYGQPADLDAIGALCRTHGLLLLEDCAQAHGSRFDGAMVGTVGDLASFSFYPGKNLGAYGDAGAMVARDPKISARARMLANHGQERKHLHHFEGRNSRLDGIQAAVLSVKLPHLDAWNDARRRLARSLTAALAPQAHWLTTPTIAANREHAFHLYVVRTARRDALGSYLREHGIASAVHYPAPLPLMPAYARLGIGAEDIPNAARACGEVLSLPIFPEMTETQIGEIAGAVKGFAETAA